MTVNSLNDYNCKNCGKCCNQDAIITIYDINRIAKNLDLSDREVFENSIKKNSFCGDLFIIKRNSDGFCVFFDKNKKCTIHSFKPRICHFFPCNSIKDMKKWIRKFQKSAPFETFWEHYVAEKYTREYVQSFGTNWNENEYFKTIEEIKKYIITEEGEKIIVSKKDNLFRVIKYNCSKCEYYCCQKDFEITLPDILKISIKTKTPIEEIFENSIEKNNDTYSMRLKKINNKCIYFYNNEEKYCKIYDFRPMFCRLAPCKKIIHDEENWKRFFLGSGTIGDHWKLNISITITQEYVKKIGIKYSKLEFDEHINKINTLLKEKKLMDEFFKNISQYRYLGDFQLPFRHLRVFQLLKDIKIKIKIDKKNFYIHFLDYNNFKNNFSHFLDIISGL